MTKNLPERWKRHLQEAKHGRRRSILYSAIRKYGKASFVVEVLETCSEAKLAKRERYWIRRLKPRYNMTEGGFGGDTLSTLPPRRKNQLRKLRRENAKALWSTPEYREKFRSHARSIIMYRPSGRPFKKFSCAIECAAFLGLSVKYVRQMARYMTSLKRHPFVDYTIAYHT